MADGRTRLWPYSNKVALISAPLIWCFVAVCLYAIHTYWRLEASSFSRLILVGLAIGLIPLLLLLLDYIAQSRAVIDVKGVKLDFSQTDIAIHTGH
jgi:hypothetical protein